MTFTASQAASSSLSPAFGFTIKLRSFDTRPPDPIIVIIPAPVVEPEPEVEEPEGPLYEPEAIENAFIIRPDEVEPDGAGTVTPVNPVETPEPEPVPDEKPSEFANLIDESLD